MTFNKRLLFLSIHSHSKQRNIDERKKRTRELFISQKKTTKKTSTRKQKQTFFFSLLQELNGRRVTVLKHGDAVHCFDSLCHHQGGDLGGLGDIEDFKGNCVIVCPVHRRRVSLATGDVLDTDLEGKVCAAPGGPKQRIHAAYVDIDGAVRVVLNSTDLPRESDRYNVVAGVPSTMAAVATAPMTAVPTALAPALAAPTTAATSCGGATAGGGINMGLGSGYGVEAGVVSSSRGSARGLGAAYAAASASASNARRPSPSSIAAAAAAVVVPGAALSGIQDNGLTPYAGSDAATKYEAQRAAAAAAVAAAAAAALATTAGATSTISFSNSSSSWGSPGGPKKAEATREAERG